MQLFICLLPHQTVIEFYNEEVCMMSMCQLRTAGHPDLTVSQESGSRAGGAS